VFLAVIIEVSETQIKAYVVNFLKCIKYSYLNTRIEPK